MSMCTKFGLIWINISGTSFVKHQHGSDCIGETSITWVYWIWLKICVLGLFGMVNMCAKFHSHWTHIASTCFTMWPTDQKSNLDDAHTWFMGFGSNLVWWSYMVVGSCHKSFKANGIPNHALASQCSFATFKL